MGKLLENERFKHVDYKHTDLRKTFARIRAQQHKKLITEEPGIKVIQLIKKRPK